MSLQVQPFSYYCCFRYANCELARILISDYGADIHAKGPDDMTPFHFACRYTRDSQFSDEEVKNMIEPFINEER